MPEGASMAEIVYLKHPHTGDVKHAAVGTNDLLVLMGNGYRQIPAPTEAVEPDKPAAHPVEE
jgi:hypothetical protein